MMEMNASDEEKAMHAEHSAMMKDEYLEMHNKMMPYAAHMKFKYCLAMPHMVEMMAEMGEMMGEMDHDMDMGHGMDHGMGHEMGIWDMENINFLNFFQKISQITHPH